MADEVRASQTGPNGERLEIKLGSRSLGITSRDLLMFAFVAGIFVFIYLASQNNRESFARIYTAQGKFQETQQQTVADIKTLLRDAGDELKDLLREHNAQVEAQTAKVLQMLRTHQWNEGKEPAVQLPLDVPPPPPHQEGR
jgi:hypothetical protein